MIQVIDYEEHCLNDDKNRTKEGGRFLVLIRSNSMMLLCIDAFNPLTIIY